MVTAAIGEAFEKQASAYREKVEKAADRLLSGSLPYSGWVGYAGSLSEELLADIEDAAAEIAANSKYVVSIGIGGSYLGARAMASFLKPGDFGAARGYPELLFAGHNLSGIYHEELLTRIADDDFSVIIISKSGGTLEPGAAFEMFKKLLIDKYGEEEAYARIYAVTDADGGKLRAEADANGYRTFPIPADIGGRYSVQTPVGLLPLAATGVPIREFLAGAAASEGEETLAEATRIAAARAALEQSKSAMTLNYFEPCLEHFAGWLQQLFGESEGKDGRGVLPTPLSISADLHSVGQYLQDGKQTFYEMNLFLEDGGSALAFGADGGEYAGRSYAEFNKAVHEGLRTAHLTAGIPILEVSIPDRSAYTFGRLVYLFELTCALTALLMGVNPFDQPGVEAYKAGMKAYLTKNG
jgi:glucose-6-phosphate isomerase